MLKYIVAALSAVCLALAGYVQYQRVSLSEQKQTIATQAAAIRSYEDKIKRDARTAASRAAKAKATAIKDKEATSAKDKALAASPEWAAQPLPAGVADWVRNQGNGVRP